MNHPLKAAHDGLKTTMTKKIQYSVHPAVASHGWMDGGPEAYLRAADGYVEAVFSGSKAGLKAIYEKLIETAFALGSDVKACPCKTIVPLYRRHVFAQIKPTTKTRIDFGLALKDTKATSRLIDTGGLAQKDRITHRIEVSTTEQVDDELKMWLRKAYEMDA